MTLSATVFLKSSASRFKALVLGLATLQAAIAHGADTQRPGTLSAPQRFLSNAELKAATMQRFNLSSCAVHELALPGSDALARARAAGEEVAVAVPLDGQVRHLVLRPHSLRASPFHLIVQGREGMRLEVPPPPATWRGYLREETNSVVIASLVAAQLRASIHDQALGRKWAVEPLSGRIAGAPAAAHAVFGPQDALPLSLACGAPTAVQAQTPPAAATSAAPSAPGFGGPPGANGLITPINYFYAKIAFDTDV